MTPLPTGQKQSQGQSQDPSIDRAVAARTGGLFVRDVGEGAPVLLLHAVPFNSRMWEPQFPLRDKARLLAPDLPGFGLSPMIEVHSLSDYAAAVVEALDRLGVEEVVVAGVSSGAYVAFETIAPLGNRLRGLLLANAVAVPAAEQTPLDRRRLAAEIECGGPDAAAAEYLPKLFGWTTPRLRPDIFAWLQEIVWENSPAGIAAALRAIADRPDFSSQLSEIRCPVLCLTGAEDPLTPPDAVREMADRIPVASFAVIADAGHLTNVEAPEAFNRALENFLAECESFPTPPAVDKNACAPADEDAGARRR
ncbi:MAG TPA: alpha/beta fold hydrolase [Candidatus Binatia bacterium]